MINENETDRKTKITKLIIFIMVMVICYSVLSDRVINIPPVNFNKTKFDVNVYSNDLVVITETEEINVLDERVWYLFGEVRYNTISSTLVDTKRTTLKEYLDSLP